MKLKDLLSRKPQTLALSAGYFGFFAHLGFVEALRQEGIEIEMISGASAGALIAGIIGSGLSTKQALKLMSEVPLKDIWDPGIGWGYLKWTKVESILAEHFLPRLENLRIKVAISVFEIRSFKTRVFYDGPAPAIIRASCSPPGLVHPARIGDKLYFDGGVFDKGALVGLKENQAFVSHYLRAHSPDREWEFSRVLKKQRPRQLIVSFSDLLPVKPQKLAKGVDAYHRGLQRTLELLNTEEEYLEESRNFHGDIKKFIRS